MTLLPEHDNGKPPLRYVYDNAMKGAGFRNSLEHERHRLAMAKQAMNEAGIVSGLGTFTVLTIALIIAQHLKIIEESTRAPVLYTTSVGAAQLVVTLFVSWFAGRRAAKVHHYKEHADTVHDLMQTSPDLDGVQRTLEEQQFLKSPFGVAMRALVHTEYKLDVAESLNVAEPVRAAALQGLSRARDELRTAMTELEAIWQTRSGVDAAAMIDAFAAQQRAGAILAAAAPHLTTLVMASFTTESVV